MSVPDPEDRELQELLSEADALRKRYRETAREEPPAALDEAIRAAARRSVRAKPIAAGAPFGGSWRVPLSIAAVVVVSVTLTMTMWERGEHLPVPPDQASKPGGELQQRLTDRTQGPAPSHPASPPAPGPASAPGSTALRSIDAQVSPARPRNSPGMQAKGDGARSHESAASPPAPAPGGTSAGNVAETVDARAREEKRAASEVEQRPTGKPQAGVLTEARQDGRPDIAPGAGAQAMKEAEQPGAKAESGGMPAQEAQAPAHDELAKDRVESNVARPFPNAASAAKGAPAAAASPWESSPEAWLRHVDELRSQGLLVEARASFEGFRRRYPEYELPKGFVAP